MAFWERFWKKGIDVPAERKFIVEYDGRELIVFDESRNIKERKIKQIKKEIILFFKTNIAAKQFPKITVKIRCYEEGEHAEYAGWVVPREVMQKKVIVYLNAFATH